MNYAILGTAVAFWAVVHSWLASTTMKDFARRIGGERADRLYRMAYNAFSFLSLLPVLILIRVLPDRVIYNIGAPWLFVMLAGEAVAALLLLVALLQTDTLHFIGLSQLLSIPITSGLVTRGFYSIVRHPLYLLGLLMLWLTPRMTVNLLTVYGLLTIYLFAGAILEEKRLVREFGRAYERYQAEVPMILPGLRFRRAPSPGARPNTNTGK